MKFRDVLEDFGYGMADNWILCLNLQLRRAIGVGRHAATGPYLFFTNHNLFRLNAPVSMVRNCR